MTPMFPALLVTGAVLVYLNRLVPTERSRTGVVVVPSVDQPGFSVAMPF